MKTPGWFVQEGGMICVQAVANPGKVKRLRNTGRACTPACQADVAPAGSRVEASVREIAEKRSPGNMN